MPIMPDFFIFFISLSNQTPSLSAFVELRQFSASEREKKGKNTERLNERCLISKRGNGVPRLGKEKIKNNFSWLFHFDFPLGLIDK